MLRCHNVIGTTISFTCNQGYFRDCAISIGIKQFRTVLDDAAVFLSGAWHKTWNVNQSHYWNIEGITETYKTCRLDRGLNVQTASQNQWLICHDADRAAFHTCKTNHNIFGIVRLQLKKLTIIHNLCNQLFHVIRLIRIGWDQSI